MSTVRKLHSTTSAQVWAEEFVRVITDEGGADPTDVDFMIGWFANAIETGRAAGLSGIRIPDPPPAEEDA